MNTQLIDRKLTQLERELTEYYRANETVPTQLERNDNRDNGLPCWDGTQVIGWNGKSMSRLEAALTGGEGYKGSVKWGLKWSWLFILIGMTIPFLPRISLGLLSWSISLSSGSSSPALSSGAL
jgi:hypothetical protein